MCLAMTCDNPGCCSSQVDDLPEVVHQKIDSTSHLSGSSSTHLAGSASAASLATQRQRRQERQEVRQVALCY